MQLALPTSLRTWLPRGNTLSQEAFDSRHRILRALLLMHVPVLFAWGLVYGVGAPHAAAEVAAPIACWLAAGQVRNRRFAAFFVTAGLVWCSSVIVHLSGGSIEAHFHFFIVIPFITLYQDWPPFLWAVSFTVLSHGIGSWLRPDLMFNHQDAIARPWTWSLVHGVAVAFASVGAVTFWRAAELEQRRASAVASDLAAATEHSTAREASHRTFSDLLVTLARRNQNLIERQLEMLDHYERDERDERVLDNLFRLDHLATRMRRNAESLIVLSGTDVTPRTSEPQPVSEIVRGAIGEVEDYQRVDLMLQTDPLVVGRVVSGIAHLLAELVENATTFSPAGSRVGVTARILPGGECQIGVIDSGMGMSDADLARYNERLAEPPEVDVDLVRMLGLHVVGRIARRYGLRVELIRNPAAGVTALVTIPATLVVSLDSLPTAAEALPTRVPASAPAIAAAPAQLDPRSGPSGLSRFQAGVNRSRADESREAGPPAWNEETRWTR
jgi:signal transduction histidine kinase